jgi:hypothetical protein
MVHGLEVLKALNAKACSNGHAPKPSVPESIALNPALVRRYLNRPWTREELGGKESVYEAYARSEREPFRNREPECERARA